MANIPNGFQTFHGATDELGNGAVLDADPMIDGVQYRTIPSDPQELARLRAMGLNVQNHPQYGWIAPDDAKYAAAFPDRASSSIFDFGPMLIPALMTAGGAFAGINSMAGAGTAATGAAGGGGAASIPGGVSGFTGASGATPDLFAELAFDPLAGQIGGSGIGVAEAGGLGSMGLSNPMTGTDWAERAQVGNAEDMFNAAGSGGMTSGAAGLPFGLTGRDLLAAGTNFITEQQKADQLNQVSQQAFNAAPINQPQRAPYQSQLLNLMQNPSEFFQTNPLFNAQKDQARQAFEANYAKQGMGGTSIDAYMKNIMNAGAGTYFDQGNLLAGLGGFTQGAGNAGAGAQAGIAGANAQTSAFNSAAPLLGKAADTAFDDFSSLFKFSEPNALSGTQTTFA